MQERPLTTINQAGEDSAPVFEVDEPTDGQVLAYDGDSGKWKNADAGGGSGSGGLLVTVTWDETTLTLKADASYKDIKDAMTNGGCVCVYVTPGASTVSGNGETERYSDIVEILYTEDAEKPYEANLAWITYSFKAETETEDLVTDPIE